MLRSISLALLIVGLAACIPPPPARDPFAAVPKAGSGPAATATRVILSDVDTPGYKLTEDPDGYALVIGIEKYPELPEARFAERDAASMRQHLLALGYPGRNILYLSGKDASRAGMEKYLESWLPRNVTDKSRVFVYFSGHGAPGAQTGQAYLVPWDGDIQFLETTGYPLQRLYEKLGALPAREVLVALDACFSGAGGRSVLAKGTRPLVTKVETSFSGKDRMVALTASASEEVTGSDEAQGHGLFTYYLLKALNERKGRATVREAYDFLRERVRDAARRQNRDQTPQLLPPDLGPRSKAAFRG